MPKNSISIELGGKTRHLRFTFNALVALEEELGISTFDIGEILAKPRLKPIRALIWASLLHEDKSLTPGDVGEMLEGEGKMLGIERLGEFALKAAEAFMFAFPDAEDVSKNESSQVESKKSGTGEDT